MSENKQKFKDLFRRWELNSIRLNINFAELEFSPTNDDQIAAWDMYVELITRITTQPLATDVGDEETALASVYSLFGITRSILKEKGRNAPAFTKIAVIVLNQIIRPFTAKWHRKQIENAFVSSSECMIFRRELSLLQVELTKYAKMLAELARVEDLTALVQE